MFSKFSGCSSFYLRHDGRRESDSRFIPSRIKLCLALRTGMCVPFFMGLRHSVVSSNKTNRSQVPCLNMKRTPATFGLGMVLFSSLGVSKYCQEVPILLDCPHVFFPKFRLWLLGALLTEHRSQGKLRGRLRYTSARRLSPTINNISTDAVAPWCEGTRRNGPDLNGAAVKVPLKPTLVMIRRGKRITCSLMMLLGFKIL